MNAACNIEVQAMTRKTASGSTSTAPISEQLLRRSATSEASGRRRAHKLGAADLDQGLVHRTRDFQPPPLRRDHGVDQPPRDFVERAPSERLAIRLDRSGHL